MTRQGYGSGLCGQEPEDKTVVGTFQGKAADLAGARGGQVVAHQPVWLMLVRTWPLWQRRHSPRRAQVPRGGRGSTLMTRVSRSCVASPDWHPGQGWSQGEGWLLLFSWTQCLLSQSFSITKRDSFPNTSPLAAGNLYPRSPQLGIQFVK